MNLNDASNYLNCTKAQSDKNDERENFDVEYLMGFCQYHHPDKAHLVNTAP